MMKERPILFSGAMVRAILEGRKTQTRRIVKPQPLSDALRGPEIYCPVVVRRGEEEAGAPVFGIYDDTGEYGCKCPYGQPGDRLWLRESVYCDDGGGINDFTAKSVPWEHVYYRADGECCQQIPECQCASIGKPKWTPSIHMPRWASRILLEVVSVRVERLQAISEVDAIAEGIERAAAEWKNYRPEKSEDFQMFPWVQDPVYSYETLWEKINGPGSWEENPWVWVLEFRRV